MRPAMVSPVLGFYRAGFGVLPGRFWGSTGPVLGFYRAGFRRLLGAPGIPRLVGSPRSLTRSGLRARRRPAMGTRRAAGRTRETPDAAPHHPAATGRAAARTLPASALARPAGSNRRPGVRSLRTRRRGSARHGRSRTAGL